MTNCPNCGAKINSGENFCGVCGFKLKNQQETNNTNNIPENNFNRITDIETNLNTNGVISNISNSTNMKNNNQINLGNYNNEELIDVYIGKNSSKLKNGGFSFNTLFIGVIYVFYRKMWLLGVIWLLLTMFIFPIIPKLSFILEIVTDIIVSIFFKKWYLKDVKEKIEKIKLNNPNDSPRQLLEKCRNKGGTTIVPVIIIIVLRLLFTILMLFAFSIVKDEILNPFEEEFSNNSSYDKNSSFNKRLKEELNFEVSNEFEEKLYDGNFIYYNLKDKENNNCNFIIKKDVRYSEYKNPEDYIKLRILTKADDEVSQIEKININNKIWSAILVKSDLFDMYYYVTFKNDNVYTIIYTINLDSGKCTREMKKLINTLEFK